MLSSAVLTALFVRPVSGPCRLRPNPSMSQRTLGNSTGQSITEWAVDKSACCQAALGAVWPAIWRTVAASRQWTAGISVETDREYRSFQDVPISLRSAADFGPQIGPNRRRDWVDDWQPGGGS